MWQIIGIILNGIIIFKIYHYISIGQNVNKMKKIYLVIIPKFFMNMNKYATIIESIKCWIGSFLFGYTSNEYILV